MGLHGNALLALLAAIAWGGGDFSGGLGAKAMGGSARGALRVILLALLVSFLVLLAIVVLRHEAMPRGRLLGWGLLAGVAGGVSLTSFYVALSRGEMGVSAAISGVLAAAIPAVVSMGVEGPPGVLRLAGFALALAAIWVIAAGSSPENAGPGKATLGLAVLAGVGFGVYFVALRMANPLGIFMPMALARGGSLVTCGVMLLALQLRRGGRAREQVPDRWNAVAVLCALSVALFDTGGNLLYIGATRLGRLDVAAVLGSLYPASTILLAAWRLQERPTKRQLAGMGVALAAVVLITL